MTVQSSELIRDFYTWVCPKKIDLKNNDKVLFWISGALTSFCLSYYLQKKIDSDFFAIIDAYDKPRVFFENQNLVTFEKTWFYHDFFKNIKKPDLKYLSNFEK